MCGIVGSIQQDSLSLKDFLLNPLGKLEYRGYDSVGWVTDGLDAVKNLGKLSVCIGDVPDDITFNRGISHTRWATHGKPSVINSHPHHNTDKDIYAVHNGIIKNYQDLKSFLESKGYTFITETDSEVIPMYFDYYVKKENYSIEETIHRFFNEIQGTYAVLLMTKWNDKMYAWKKDSPLVLGIENNNYVIASDSVAFKKPDHVIFFDDKEYAVIDPRQYQIFDSVGNQLEKQAVKLEVEEDDLLDGKYPHYMIKEINDQPKKVNKLLNSLLTDQKHDLERLTSLIKLHKRTVFLSCGTSYNAGTVVEPIFNQMGHDFYSVIASEFDSFYKVDSDTLIIAISQSGETMDVVTSLKTAEVKGATIASIVNVPYSTIQRMSAVSLDIKAGKEIGVASTKAFTNQVVLLMSLANTLGANIDLSNVSDNIQYVIDNNTDKVMRLSETLSNKSNMFVLGKGISFPVTQEIALKIKEITYIHSEGMRAGELKHGTIALIENGTPVIGVGYNDDLYLESALKEVESRGAENILITNGNSGDFDMPTSNGMDFYIYSVVIGQLLSYYICLELGHDVDTPRNLAKSVTV